MTSFAAPIAEQIWNDKYRFKKNDGTPIDETIESTWSRIAHALAEPEGLVQVDYEEEFFDALKDFKFLPAGRITAGAGTARAVTLFNCFVMGTIPDSMDGIFSMLREAALTMQQGGGIGYDFSPIRPKGAEVKKLGADASGPLTFMDCWDAMCRTVMSAGSRRGAMMATMRCDHPDIEDFIEAKQDSARLRMFNLSVLVTDAFMHAVEENEDWPLVHVEPPSGPEVPEIIDHYGETGRDGDGLPRYLHRRVKARDLWNKIMQSTYDYAEPGVIFIDRVNQANNLNYVEKISSTNPCGEQPLPPYGACLLGSINLSRLVANAFETNAGLDSVELKKLVATAVRMMDNVIDVSNFPLPEQEKEAKAKRRIGLGVTGLADALMMVGLRYGSPEAAARTEKWMQMVAEAAYRASVELAKEKGAFPLFDAEEYLSDGHHVAAMPEDLKEEIREHGIRNALLTSIAPTGTISLYAGNVSSGIEPVFALSYTRKVLEKDGSHRHERVEDYAVARYREWWEANARKPRDTIFDPEVHLPDYFVTAQDLAPEDHVVMQAAAQKWIDSSISKTINVPEDISFEDFKGVYWSAFENGCKGCTTYRPNEVTGSVLSVDEKPERWSDLPAFLVAVQDRHDRNSADMGQKKSFAHFQDVCSLFGVEEAADVPVERRQEFIDYMESTDPEDRSDEEVAAAHEAFAKAQTEDSDILGPTLEELLERSKGRVMTEEESTAQAESFARANLALDRAEDPLPERPEALDGTTYKIKVGDIKAVYLTVSDINEGGQVRPFEIFLRSSDPTHDEWMTTLARMISAILRRPFPADFVPAELMRIHSSVTGGFQRGNGYQPSLVAAIGRKLKEHMDARKALNAYRVEFGHNTPDELKRAMTMTAPYGDMGNVAWPEDATKTMAANRAASCPKCFSFNLKVESGCLTCMDCGHSKCG
tara:strand:+ start:5715 stop:8513 length:2799 start_codon:yes stop_codon:yes gene_type:complete